MSAQEPAAAGARGGRGAGANAIPEKTTLLLLGTQGGPGVGLMRAQTASVVFAGGQPYLVDCGYGTVRGLVQAGLRFAQISNVFVSHLHNDHTADIAALLSMKWTGGQANVQPTTVWGPPGTQAMVDGAIAFFKGDTEIRTVDEGRTVKAEAVFKGRDLSAPKVTEVFKDERVTVQAIENTHFPDRAKAKMAHRSFAYRFNAPDRSVVLPAIRRYSPGLVELARGADVFVCEAMTMANSGNSREVQGAGAATAKASGGTFWRRTRPRRTSGAWPRKRRSRPSCCITCSACRTASAVDRPRTRSSLTSRSTSTAR